MTTVSRPTATMTSSSEKARARWLKFGVFFVIVHGVLAVAACKRATTETKRGRVGVSLLRISQPVFVAAERGLFTKHGLDGAQAIIAMLANLFLQIPALAARRPAWSWIRGGLIAAAAQQGGQRDDGNHAKQEQQDNHYDEDKTCPSSTSSAHVSLS